MITDNYPEYYRTYDLYIMYEEMPSLIMILDLKEKHNPEDYCGMKEQIVAEWVIKNKEY